MAKLTLTDISSGYLSTTTYNANNTLIETALENTLSRDGTSPNTMSANLDMNSNKIVNVTDPTGNQDAATKAYVDSVTGGIDTLAELTDVTSAAYTSGYVLVADGAAYVGRALVEADISDLGTYLTSVSEANVETALASATAFTVNNYVFNCDQTVGAGQDNYVLTYDHGTGEIGLEAAAAGGLANVVEDTTPQLGGDLDMNSNNITAAGPTTISPTEMSYLDGVTSNLQTQLNAKGTLSNVVEDTTPQLGGNLDTNSNNISGAGTLDMAPNARSVSASTNTATTDYSKIINLTGGTGQTFTLDGDPPTNALIFIDNQAGAAWTIAASTSLIWAADATTGNRTLADDGVAIAKHRGSGTWIISGSDLLT